MTKTAEAGDLAKHLAQFLDEVKAGHEVLVTSGTTPVARLVPLRNQSRFQPRSIRGLRALAGTWVGKTTVKSDDVAEEIFARE